jgi:hypothetical protein
MNVQNLYVLEEAVSNLGLTDCHSLFQELKQLITPQLLKFEIETVILYDDCKMEIKLCFTRSLNSDVYSFSKLDCFLRYGVDTLEDRAQSFYRIHFIPTIKEAYNLLQGRAVNKDVKSPSGEKYNAWIELNFYEKDLHGNHKLYYYRSKNRYDLAKTLELYPIREILDEEFKASLVIALKAGDSCLVTLDRSRKSERVCIEANPRLKTINIYPTSSLHQSH